MAHMAGLEYIYIDEIDTGVLDLMDRVSVAGFLPCFC